MRYRTTQHKHSKAYFALRTIIRAVVYLAGALLAIGAFWLFYMLAWSFS